MVKEKIAFVFPGQGAQYVGMAKDLFDEYAVVRHTFEQVSDISNKDIAKVCFYGPNYALNDTEITSLGTFAHSLSIARIIEDHFGKPIYNIAYAITGHSMGQYSALCCAGSLEFKDVIRLLSARSKSMKSIDTINGGMACIAGANKEVVESCLEPAKKFGFVVISNHNARDQFTLSGEIPALDAAIAEAKKKNVRIAKRLNISVPAHCKLMAKTQGILRRELDSVNVLPPKTNWFSNQTGAIMVNPLDVKDALADQMTHGVRWLEIMEKFPEYKISSVYELGPGKTLSGLIKHANLGIPAQCTDNLKNVRAMIEQLEKLIML